MKWRIWCHVLVVALLASIAFANVAVAQYAAAVVSYDAGTTPASGYTSPDTVLGPPERYTGEDVYPQIVSAFNPPWAADEIVSIGEAGEITLRLSNYVSPQAGGPEIGVFTNSSLLDTSTWPNLIGQASDPAVTLGVADSAVVEVSEDGLSWTSLNSGDGITFDIPTNGYNDLSDPYSSTPGSVSSVFHQPFTGSLTSFDGLPYDDANATDILEVLDGSGGGTWLDISSTGLAQVAYIRFSVPDNGGSGLNFELDAVSIASGAVGEATVPEPTAWLLAMTFIAVGFLGRSVTSFPA